MKKRTTIALLATLFILAGSASMGYVLFNPPMKWHSGDLARNISIRAGGHGSVNDGSGGVSAIEAAIASSWNGAVPGTLTSTTVEASPPASIGDGISTMHFNVAGTGCSGSCLAVTITPYPSTSAIETVNGVDFQKLDDADIFFNPSSKFYSSNEADGCKREYHIESVAVHEVGHLLALDHTPNTSATMYAYTDKCNETGVSLAADDIDGINCIYTNGAGCGSGCVANTLIVDRTECSSPPKGKNRGDFVVETWIVDNCGGPAAGATVTIDVTDPSGTPLTCSGDTSSSGRLACSLDNPPSGLYQSTVSNVSKAGHSWSGGECGSGACDCSITIN